MSLAGLFLHRAWESSHELWFLLVPNIGKKILLNMVAFCVDEDTTSAKLDRFQNLTLSAKTSILIVKWDSRLAIWYCNECFFYSNQRCSQQFFYWCFDQYAVAFIRVHIEQITNLLSPWVSNSYYRTSRAYHVYCTICTIKYIQKVHCLAKSFTVIVSPPAQTFPLYFEQSDD